MPFPIAAYQHNVFFDFAGNLIGLVLVFSFLVPLGLMLKALVNEREARLRELLLIMGDPNPNPNPNPDPNPNHYPCCSSWVTLALTLTLTHAAHHG